MTKQEALDKLDAMRSVMDKLPAGVEVLDFHADGIFMNGRIDIEEAAAALGVPSVENKPVKWSEDTVKAFFCAGDVRVYTYEKTS